MNARGARIIGEIPAFCGAAESLPHLLLNRDDIDPSVAGPIGIRGRQRASAITIALGFTPGGQILRDWNLRQRESRIKQANVQRLADTREIASVQRAERRWSRGAR
jgi:hypothetical protein